MALFLAMAIALISLIITPEYHFSFDITPKIAALLAATGLLLVPAAWSRVKPDWKSPLYRRFTWLLLLTAISLAVSAVLSSRSGLSWFGTNWRRYGSVTEGTICLLAWLVVAVCAGRPERVRVVLRGIAVAGAIASAYGIAQYLGWDPFLSRETYEVGEGIWTIVRPPGTLGYASYFATWLLMVASLSMALAAMEDSPKWRRFAFTVSAVAAFAMWLTGTRAAMLGLLAGGAIWFAIRKIRLTRRLGAVCLSVLLLCAGFYYSPLGQPMRSRTRWFTEDPSGGARILLWRDSLNMAGHRLLTGYGPETFTAEFPRYESAQLARTYPEFSHESPHNMFLDALLAQGIPGLVLLLGLFGLAFATRKRPEITAGLAALVVSQQFTAFTAPTAMMFFVGLALSVALETPVVPRRHRTPAAALALPVAAALVYLAVRISAADHQLALVQHALDNTDLPSARNSYGDYERLRLPGGSGDLWYSRALLEFASHAPHPDGRAAAEIEAEKAAQRAASTAEDPFNAWYNLSVVYGSRNDAIRSEQSDRAAIAARPNWYKPHWILAQMLELQGRRDEAKQEAELAADLNGGKDPEVARTLREITGGLPRVGSAPNLGNRTK